MDIFLSKALPTSEAVTVMKIDSDHYPVVIELTIENTSRRKTIRKIHWMQFMSLCYKLQHPAGAIPKDGIETAAKHLTEHIQRVLRLCAVDRPMSFTDRWELNEREKGLLRKKYKVKERWSISRSMLDKRALNQLKRKVEEMINRKKEEHLGMTIAGEKRTQ